MENYLTYLDTSKFRIIDKTSDDDIIKLATEFLAYIWVDESYLDKLKRGIEYDFRWWEIGDVEYWADWVADWADSMVNPYAQDLCETSKGYYDYRNEWIDGCSGNNYMDWVLSDQQYKYYSALATAVLNALEEFFLNES